MKTIEAENKFSFEPDATTTFKHADYKESIGTLAVQIAKVTLLLKLSLIRT